MVTRKIVNPKSISALPLEGHPEYTCVWDVCAAPNGDVYTSLCTEGMPAGLNAILYKLPAGSDKLVECVSNRDITCQDPSTGQMPHSKIHTTMQYHDGKLYYCTYTTSPGVGHEFWDVTQLHDDPVQGYTGSHFAVYDTETGHYESWGMPAPRHMIYGGLLDPERRRYYYHTSVNGRLGYVDLDGRRFVDIGRVTRRGGFSMFHDSRGRIFGATREGQIWRYDPDADRVELLTLWLPRRDPDAQGEIYIIHVNQMDDGTIVGGCRNGNPFWRYDPHDGPEGSIETLGEPWDRLPSGSADTGWIGIVARDGYLYYWTCTVEGEDTHLVRMSLETREREDLGGGFVDGKWLGTWMGPGAIGPDGRIYWGDSAYATPRLLVFDPAVLKDEPSPVDAEMELDEREKTPTGPGITTYPRDASWSQTGMPGDRTRAIRHCGHSVPYGSCAITSLAALPGGGVAGLTSGDSCALFEYDRCEWTDRTRVVFSTGIAGTASQSLVVSPEGDIIFGLSPSDVESALYRVKQGNAPEVLHTFTDDAVRTLAADWMRGVLYVLTTRSNKVVRLDLSGAPLGETECIRDKQVSPALAIDREGNLYGAAGGGRIWRMPFGKDEVETLELTVPSLKGRSYQVEWQAAAVLGNTIYGSSSDGYLFRFEPAEERLVNLGKPLIELGMRALAVAPDGTVFGAGGAPEYGLAHVFSYHPSHGFTDLGQPDSGQFPFGCAIKVACCAVSNDGMLYIGEDDDISHLWEYDLTVKD